MHVNLLPKNPPKHGAIPMQSLIPNPSSGGTEAALALPLISAGLFVPAVLQGCKSPAEREGPRRGDAVGGNLRASLLRHISCMGSPRKYGAQPRGCPSETDSGDVGSHRCVPWS